MKTTIYILLLVFLGLQLNFAQVGIGTTTPKTTLQVQGDASNTNLPDGIQVPTLTITELEGKIIGGAYGTEQDGTIIYVSDASVGSTIPATANIKNKGFYFYNHNGVSGTWRVITNQRINMTNPDRVPRFDGTNLIEGSIIDSGGNIGIGTITPDALLDVEGTFQFKNGSEGKSKFLTSDENGNANWASLQAENIFGEGNVPDPNFSCLAVSGSLNTGPLPTSVAVEDDYAYVVDSDSNDLKVIDISNPASPSLAGSLGSIPFPESIAVAGNYAYVVDSTSEDLKVIDVSNPATPSLAGSLGIGSFPVSITVAGNYAYVVDENLDDLKVIDISNPASPSLTGSLGIGAFPKSLAVAGNYAYVVDSGSDDLKVIDISNPASPSLTGSLGIGLGPSSVAVAGNYAYVVDSFSNDLKVIDISNPASPSLVGSLGIGTTPISIAVAANYAYVVDFGSDDLKVIDISNPASPNLVVSLGIGSVPRSIAVSGNYAYVVDSGSNDLKIINLSCSTNTTFNFLSNQFEAEQLVPLVWTENGNSISNVNTGNVGIGISNPSYVLHTRIDATNTSVFSNKIGMYLENSNTDGSLSNPNEVGLGFGRNGLINQAILAGTFGNDWLKFYVADLNNPKMTMRFNGNIGIGTENPSSKLDVEGDISASTLSTGHGFNELYRMNQDVQTFNNVSFARVNTGPGLTEVHLMNQNLRSTDNVTFNDINVSSDLDVYGASGSTSITGQTSMFEQIRIFHPNDSAYRWSIGHQVAFPSSTDDDLYFYVNKNGTQNVAGVILDQNPTTTMNFTGQHRSLVDGVDYFNKEQTESLEGLIVVADKNEYINMSGGISQGQDAITVNEALPVVSLSTKAKDKSVFGVISMLESADRQDNAGAFATPYKKEKGDERFYINSVGEGGIWIIDSGQPLESGDFIQTSDVKGYGMRQDDDLLHNYTVAKITMDCDFEPELRMKQQIKRIANEDGSYENVLDQFGRVEWEPMLDNNGKVIMELPYKMRYLDAKGETITKKDYEQLILDGKEAYRAAFVGCTYHCG